MSNENEAGKIVVTHGAVHYQRPAQMGGECLHCSSGCKTDCLRSEVRIDKTGTDDSLFKVDFDSLDLDMYDDFDAVL